MRAVKADDRQEPGWVDELVGTLDPISLDQLDERAALRERVDTKYVVSRPRLVTIVDHLRSASLVQEIDRHRSFDYESVYFGSR